MINLTDKLIAVLVPEKSKNHNLLKFKTHAVIEYIQWLSDDKEFNASENIGGLNVELLNYKIIGTITKSGEFEGFDCEEYVEKSRIKKSWNDFMSEVYKNYMTPETQLISKYCDTKEESFISLLNSKGIFLEELNNQKILILEKL
jgi:hypothetical protein